MSRLRVWTGPEEARSHLEGRGFEEHNGFWYNETGVHETLDDWEAVDYLAGLRDERQLCGELPLPGVRQAGCKQIPDL
jgi:hypothetical protein